MANRYGEKKTRLTREQEQQLAEIIQYGLQSDEPEDLQKGIDAYQELVECNINMAIAWAMDFKDKTSGRVNQLEDYLQTAMEALCQSALKYKPGPVGFGIFCKKIVQNSLSKDRARNAYCISLADQYFLEIQRIKDRKAGIDDGHKPLFVEKDSITKLEIIGAGAVYLDQEANDEAESGTIGELIPDPNAYIEIEPEEKTPEEQKQLQLLRDAMAQLNEYENKIIRLRYGFDGEEMSYAQIGCIYKINASTMQKRVQNAERKIRKIIGFEDWKTLPYIKPRLYRRKKS